MKKTIKNLNLNNSNKELVSFVDYLNSNSFNPILKNLNKNQILKLKGDASTRQYFRLEVPSSKKNQIFKSYILCLDPTNLTNEDFHPFLTTQKFFSQFKLPVPEVYFFESHKNFSLYLQEDLGNLTFLNFLSSKKTPLEEYNLYSQSLDIIKKIHNIPIKNLILNHTESIDIKKHNFLYQSFDVDKLMYEVDFSIEHFLKFICHRNSSNINNKDEYRIIRDIFLKICQKLAKYLNVLCHRDFHSRNIMIKNNNLYMIDFQDSRLGNPAYDLSSLLDDCYFTLNDDVKKKLLKKYWKDCGEQIFKGSFEDFYQYYLIMAIQRLFKAIGSFSSFYHLKSNPDYLIYIHSAFNNLRLKLSQNSTLSQGDSQKLKVALSKMYFQNL
jgi:aminoglycoside/choline kinase family phosphotransferase